MTIRKPNFFIIGAPKCGTSALAEYLAAHPQIYFCPGKEPQTFASQDLPSGTYVPEGTYLSLFSEATENHVAVGEGSTWYLRFERAIQRIKDFDPQAKFVVMLRNPIDMAYSLHSQELYLGHESVFDFREAIKLEIEERHSTDMGSTASRSVYTRYLWRCKLGEQVEALLRLVDRKSVCFVSFEEFSRDPRGQYERVLSFLGLPFDERSNFPIVNSSHRFRWDVVRKIDLALRQPGPKVRAAKAFAKRLAGVQSFRIHHLFDEVTRTAGLAHIRRPPMPADLRGELKAFFVDDLRLLYRLVGIPL